jgi:3-oxoacyl-[acyl-carrier protein] reductase
MNITEESIIITGSASGFGKALATYLQPRVNKLYLIDIKDEILQVASKISNAEGYICDLTDHGEVEKTLQNIVSANPSVKILINNAGVIHNELMYNFFNRNNPKHSIESWHKMLDVNLNSVFYTSLNFIEHMINKRIKGLIINISSISAGGNAGQTAYSAAKAAVNAMTTAWSRELSMFGIRTAAISPGFFETNSTHNALAEKVVKKIEKEIPLHRLGKTDELCNAVKFIIENDYYNGKTLELDGGMVLSNI